MALPGMPSEKFKWRTFPTTVVYLQGGTFVRSQQGEPNGLESTEDRRSVGRHGNQHVYVRHPQVSGSALYTFSVLAQVDIRA